MRLMRKVAGEMLSAAKWYALAAVIGGAGAATWAWFDPSVLQPLK